MKTLEDALVQRNHQLATSLLYGMTMTLVALVGWLR